METAQSPRLAHWRRLFLFAAGIWCLLLLVGISHSLLSLQKNSSQPLPFGFFTQPDGSLSTQDFSYNIVFLHGIMDRVVDRPYSLAGQEQMVRRMLPFAAYGMTHAYSPVALVLGFPLLQLSAFHAYLAWFFVALVGIVLLLYLDLLPKTESPLQFAALGIVIFSVCTVTGFQVGQTAMISTILVGFFWVLLQRRHGVLSARWRIDLPLAVLFWALCFKPSIAVIPFILLICEQAWVAFAVGTFLLLLTWTLLADRYGGWWTGLSDYSYMINHYNNAALTPFLQRYAETSGEQSFNGWLFAFDRAAMPLIGVILVALRWTHRITLSELFQLTVWGFLLFSPYLLACEDWILCLLIVEGTFFKSTTLPVVVLKLLLLVCIFNVRSNIGLPETTLQFPCKFALFVWLVVEIIRAKGLHHHFGGERQSPT